MAISFKKELKNKLTVAKVKTILSDLISNTRKIVDIEDIQKIVCRYYGINITNMLSKKRNKNLVYARQIAMYLAKNLSDKSLADIGQAFKRDHTTVIHSNKEIKKKLQNSKAINQEYEDLCLQINDY